MRFFRPVFAVLIVLWTVRCIKAAVVLSDRAYMPAAGVAVWAAGTVLLLVLLPASRWLATHWRQV